MGIELLGGRCWKTGFDELFVSCSNLFRQPMLPDGDPHKLGQDDVVVFLPVSCSSGFTNPTTLHVGGWTNSGAIGTLSISGTGTLIVVAEYGRQRSSLALLKVQPTTGCTFELATSPYLEGIASKGWYSVAMFPTRPF